MDSDAVGSGEVVGVVRGEGEGAQASGARDNYLGTTSEGDIYPHRMSLEILLRRRGIAIGWHLDVHQEGGGLMAAVLRE